MKITKLFVFLCLAFSLTCMAEGRDGYGDQRGGDVQRRHGRDHGHDRSSEYILDVFNQGSSINLKDEILNEYNVNWRILDRADLSQVIIIWKTNNRGASAYLSVNGIKGPSTKITGTNSDFTLDEYFTYYRSDLYPAQGSTKGDWMLYVQGDTNIKTIVVRTGTTTQPPSFEALKINGVSYTFGPCNYVGNIADTITNFKINNELSANAGRGLVVYSASSPFQEGKCKGGKYNGYVYVDVTLDKSKVQLTSEGSLASAVGANAVFTCRKTGGLNTCNVSKSNSNAKE